MGAAGEKEGRPPLHHRRHRIAVHPMGRNQQPVLPGPAQKGCQHLHAGKSGQKGIFDFFRFQQGDQTPGAGIKAAVSAVDHNGALQSFPPDGRQQLIRCGGGDAVFGAFRRQIRQQPGCAQNALGL